MTYTTLTPEDVVIGFGAYDLSTIPSLTAAELSSATVVRSDTTQGAPSTYTFEFSIPNILLDGSTIQLGLPFDQILMDGSAFVCTDPTTNTDLSCVATPAADSNYNYVTMNEWKCDSVNCESGTSFIIEVSSALNPNVATLEPKDFLIDFYSPSQNIIFSAPSPLEASPLLDIGELENYIVTQQNTMYTLDATEYLISFDTTSPIPAGGKINFRFPPTRIVRDPSAGITVHYGDGLTSTANDLSVVYDATNTYITDLSIGSL